MLGIAGERFAAIPNGSGNPQERHDDHHQRNQILSTLPFLSIIELYVFFCNLQRSDPMFNDLVERLFSAGE